ncbi:MAG: hypothetical protein IT377_23640 [Polyangiaceae bacterium]|nr:hypothetical protein [Polyangiaceae bacterium]
MTDPGFWMRLAIAGITATSEATFPENDLGAPDFESTAMVARTLEYFDELPPRQRRLLVMLFVLTELCAGLLSFRLSRFSRLPVRHRTWAIHSFRRSDLLVLRVLGDALKATTTMMYMSHPLAIEWIGEYRVCDRPLDPVKIAVRPAALSGATEAGR